MTRSIAHVPCPVARARRNVVEVPRSYPVLAAVGSDEPKPPGPRPCSVRTMGSGWLFGAAARRGSRLCRAVLHALSQSVSPSRRLPPHGSNRSQHSITAGVEERYRFVGPGGWVSGQGVVGVPCLRFLGWRSGVFDDCDSALAPRGYRTPLWDASSSDIAPRTVNCRRSPSTAPTRLCPVLPLCRFQQPKPQLFTPSTAFTKNPANGGQLIPVSLMTPPQRPGVPG